MKTTVYGIYGIFNATKDKWYIGQSKNVYRRLSEHKSNLKTHRCHNNEMQKDYDNGDVLVFTPIEIEPELHIEDLDIKENFYIDKLVINGKVKGYNKNSNTVSTEKKSILTRYQEAVVVIKEQQEAMKIYQEKIKSLQNDKEHLLKQNITLNDIVKKLLNI